jgi:excisionase family DNA binding protein
VRRETSEERDRERAAILDKYQTLPTEPITVRISTAVKLTGIPRMTIYELINSGHLETVKIGSPTFVRYRILQRLFEKR